MNAWSLLRRTGIVRAVREVDLAIQGLSGRLFATSNPLLDRPASLRLLACTPTYLPDHRRGAEVTLHATLAELVRRGHEARVVVGQGTSAVIDGVDVIAGPSRTDLRALAARSDLILGQLSSRQRVLRLAARFRRPAVYFVHIGNVPRHALAGKPALTVFSSDTIRRQNSWMAPALVVHPPIDGMQYATTPGAAITLVNLTEPKGAPLFFELARRLPEHEFLGVRGWGPQCAPPPLDNLEVIGPLDDMRVAYGRTRVLLAPSVYESYGRVALEAAASGIPTIAAPVPGLQEALGDAGTWVDRNDPEGWMAAITRLDDPSQYDRASDLARHRFVTLRPDDELTAFEQSLVKIALGLEA